jgi:hypothetical protein
MRALIPFAALALALAQGCIIYDHDVQVDDPPPAPVNYAPTVVDAVAGCYWDRSYHDDIWYFEADVDDRNGVYDVVSVWADVYDEWSGGVYIESFELYPTNDPYTWFSDWLGSSTYLDCLYDGYTVDFVAYDALESAGAATVWAITD